MKKTITTIMIISLISASALLFTACQNQPASDGKYSALAQCLTEKGVKYYGAYWCGHCQSQKKMFGDDFRYIDSYECDPNGKDGNPEACIEAGIQSYPSWFFPGQGLEVGVQPLETLAQKANCTDSLKVTADAGEQPSAEAVVAENPAI